MSNITNKSRIGPPIKYNDSIPKKLIDFFNVPMFQEINGKTLPSYLPTVEKFCADIDIAVSTFYLWVKKYPELSEAFSKAKQYQKNQLIQLALLGFYKEGFAKFTAINITDMKDQKDISHNVGDEAKKLIIDMG